MIEAEGLTKRFGDRLAVDGLDLHVRRGEVFGLLGPNGAGKTTTVRMLSALIAPTEGRAVIDGLVLGRDDERLRARIGILTETPGVYPRLSALQNLELFADLYGVKDVRGRLREYLEMLDLWDRRDDPAGSFSKGMRQKLAIARALLHEPALVFLDEPTSGLDAKSAILVRELVAELRAQERTVVICTHNMDEAERLCDRVAVFRRRVLELDSPDALRRRFYGRAVRVRLGSISEAVVDGVRALPFVSEVRPGEDDLLVFLDDLDAHNPSLVRTLVQAGADVVLVEEERPSLEKLYLDILEAHPEEHREAEPAGGAA